MNQLKGLAQMELHLKVSCFL
ncbi:hypothetical protein MPNT_120035 [Candidatus Methylacidithermus pantelleriae]|uniref:Uncharacterized protein n=1 Tax=Candidatus Methylacidithermus pantelleriae TaxID=2744239 RepID=A0A8J2BL99_9BACT|nr:hypothetical protein MPNT_120035 [Candidatus Methylacidithermus pantelleriae]